ncbi:MAG: transporter [Verrucomicrobia bacterium]|nr:transporter [Deltaproteobacteria bacterium]
MIRNNFNYVVVALFLAMTCSNPVLALSTTPDKPQTASISLGAEFASGKYGTDSTTRSVYMPLIATWSPNERFDIGIEVPFIYQSSSNVTTSLFSTSQSTATAKTTNKGGPGGNSGTFLQQQAGNSMASGSSSSEVSGLGDIILRFGVIALFEGTNVPQLRPSLFIKCPTSNASDGLGTGEFDFGVGVDASKWYGNLHLIGEGFYTYQGKVDEFGLKNYFSYTAGVGYQLTKSVEPMFIVKGATAPSSYSGALLEARARVIWSLTDTTALDLYGSRGIADSSPEYGGGIAVLYSF